MKKEEKELFEKTVENLKKLDKESILIIKTGAEMIAARQKMDEKEAITNQRN